MSTGPQGIDRQQGGQGSSCSEPDDRAGRRDRVDPLIRAHPSLPHGAKPAEPTGRARQRRVTPSGRPANPRSDHPFNHGERGMRLDRANDRPSTFGRQSGAARCRRHDAGQQATNPSIWIDRRAVRKRVWRHLPVGLPGHEASLCHCPVGSPVWRVGVTPSDACGLGRASSSAKGWVLTMLARKGELRVAPVPRKRAPFSPAAYARPKKPHPRGRTPARRRRDLPGRETGSRS